MLRMAYVVILAVYWLLLVRPGTDAEYCDRPVCMSVCLSVYLSVHKHISGTVGPIGTTSCVRIPCGRGSVLRRRHCAMLCTSSFMDDVTFGRNGCDAERWRLIHAKTAMSGMAMPGRSLMSVNACLVLWTVLHEIHSWILNGRYHFATVQVSVVNPRPVALLVIVHVYAFVRVCVCGSLRRKWEAVMNPIHVLCGHHSTVSLVTDLAVAVNCLRNWPTWHKDCKMSLFLYHFMWLMFFFLIFAFHTPMSVITCKWLDSMYVVRVTVFSADQDNCICPRNSTFMLSMLLAHSFDLIIDISNTYRNRNIVMAHVEDNIKMYHSIHQLCTGGSMVGAIGRFRG